MKIRVMAFSTQLSKRVVFECVLIIVMLILPLRGCILENDNIKTMKKETPFLLNPKSYVDISFLSYKMYSTLIKLSLHLKKHVKLGTQDTLRKQAYDVVHPFVLQINCFFFLFFVIKPL